MLNSLGYSFDKEGKNIRYTKSRLLSYIKMVNESFYFNLKKRIGNWVLNIINTDEDIDTKVVEEIKDYIEKDLRALFNFSLDNLELRKFLQNSNNHVTKESNISNNIFHSDDVEIEVGTVHSVKGETHVATLLWKLLFMKNVRVNILEPNLKDFHIKEIRNMKSKLYELVMLQ